MIPCFCFCFFQLQSQKVVQEFDGAYLQVEGFSKPMLNMANFDFLGMGQRKELKEAAVQALDKVRQDTTLVAVSTVADLK